MRLPYNLHCAPWSFAAGILERDRRKITAGERAGPPGARAGFGEVVAIQIGAHEFGRRVGERVAREKTQKAPVTFEKFLNDAEDPSVVFGHRGGGEPHLPVEFPMIGRDDAGPPIYIAGFAFEFVLAPFG